MSENLIIALIGFAGPAVGSMIGVVIGNKLLQYRVVKLEEKTAQQDAKHNDLDSRTHKLEGRMDAAESEISDLKQFHKPH